MMETGYSLADIAAATGNSGRNGGDDMFGGNSAWWIIVLFLFAGWGRNGGFGGNDGGNGGGGYAYPPYAYGCGGSACATQADLAAGFNNSAVLSNLNDLALGQANIQQTLCQGFNGVNTAILQTGYNTQAGINSISHQISDCCCTTQRAIDGVRYDMATQACDTRSAIYNSSRDIIDNANANSRAILDFLTKSKMEELQSKVSTLELQATIAQQNALNDARSDAAVAEILRRTGNDCPVPAYVVNSPTPVQFPTNACGVPYAGCNSGCGCNGSF